MKIVNFKSNLAIDNYNMRVVTILSELNIIIDDLNKILSNIILELLITNQAKLD